MEVLIEYDRYCPYLTLPTFKYDIHFLNIYSGEKEMPHKTDLFHGKFTNNTPITFPFIRRHG